MVNTVKPQSTIVFILVATFLLNSCSTYSTGSYSKDAYNAYEFEKGDDDFQDGITYIKENVTDPLVVIHIKTNNNAHIRVYSYDGGDYFIGEDVTSNQEVKSSIENINEISIKAYSDVKKKKNSCNCGPGLWVLFTVLTQNVFAGFAIAFGVSYAIEYGANDTIEPEDE